MNDLINKILTLVPNAKFSIHDINDPCVDDNEDQHTLSGFRVSWNRLNTSPCPSQSEIDGVA